MSLEAGVLIDDRGQPFHWHLPLNRTAGSLPDSLDLWDIIWENRQKLIGFAHSHPGSGLTFPSHTDITTFAAVEAALGTRWQWWITTTDRLVCCRYQGPDPLDYSVSFAGRGPWPWLPELRRLSYEPQEER